MAEVTFSFSLLSSIVLMILLGDCLLFELRTIVSTQYSYQYFVIVLINGVSFAMLNSLN